MRHTNNLLIHIDGLIGRITLIRTDKEIVTKIIILLGIIVALIITTTSKIITKIVKLTGNQNQDRLINTIKGRENLPVNKVGWDRNPWKWKIFRWELRRTIH